MQRGSLSAGDVGRRHFVSRVPGTCASCKVRGYCWRQILPCRVTAIFRAISSALPAARPSPPHTARDLPCPLHRREAAPDRTEMSPCRLRPLACHSSPRPDRRKHVAQLRTPAGRPSSSSVAICDATLPSDQTMLQDSRYHGGPRPPPPSDTFGTGAPPISWAMPPRLRNCGERVSRLPPKFGSTTLPSSPPS